MTFATAGTHRHESSLTYGIAVDNISVTYSNARLALYNASCYVQPGTITGLVGPNGGGKVHVVQVDYGLFITLVRAECILMICPLPKRKSNS